VVWQAAVDSRLTTVCRPVPPNARRTLPSQMRGLVHLQLTWHPVPGGRRVMPAVQLVRWALSVGLLAAVGFVFFDAWDTARNGSNGRRDR
jgi:hypothetical protein